MFCFSKGNNLAAGIVPLFSTGCVTCALYPWLNFWENH